MALARRAEEAERCDGSKEKLRRADPPAAANSPSYWKNSADAMIAATTDSSRVP
jgi:hypothetical protein